MVQSKEVISNYLPENTNIYHFIYIISSILDSMASYLIVSYFFSAAHHQFAPDNANIAPRIGGIVGGPPHPCPLLGSTLQKRTILFLFSCLYPFSFS
jgi:hypothetical protein